MAKLAGPHYIYVINFVASDHSQNKIITAWMKKTPEILSAMAPIPLCFYVKSSWRAAEIRAATDFMFPDGQFIISEINAANTDGRFRSDVWAWFGFDNDGNTNELKSTVSLNLLLADPRRT